MKIINRRSASAFTHLCTVYIIMGSYNKNINNRNRRRKKRRRHKRKIKWWLLIVELLVLFMAIGIIVLLCSSNSKAKVVSAFTKCSLGRSILSCAGKDDYNKNVLNSDFNRNNIINAVTQIIMATKIDYNLIKSAVKNIETSSCKL